MDFWVALEGLHGMGSHRPLASIAAVLGARKRLEEAKSLAISNW